MRNVIQCGLVLLQPRLVDVHFVFHSHLQRVSLPFLEEIKLELVNILLFKTYKTILIKTCR